MRFIVFNIAFMCIVLVSKTGFSASELPIATGEWIPYASEKLPGNGIIVEIVREVFNEMGITPDLRFYPWNRCVESVAAGKIWAAFPFAYHPEWKQQFFFSDIVLKTTAKLFYYRGNGTGDTPVYRYYSNLASLRIGGVKGYYYESILKNKGLNIDLAPTPQSAFEKLMLGRTDVVVANELAGWFVVNTYFPDRKKFFSTVENPFDHHSLHLIVSKTWPKSTEYLTQFNQSLARVKTMIIYKTILNKLSSLKKKLK